MAVAEFNSHEHRDDGETVVNSLYYGLNTLRNSLFTRVHEDVERNVGRDSILMPLSLHDSERKTKLEIELFQVAVSSVHTQRCAFVRDEVWYVDWLLRLRLGDRAAEESSQRRVANYLKLNDEERRLGFSRVLEKTFPQATRAPLVLYRLVPAAIGIATALAFGGEDHVFQLRRRQTNYLPCIPDCRECRGRPLDNGDQCATCGNPMWTYSWLTESD